MNTSSQPWKENRVGAVSLCYLNLQAPARDWVFAHHAAVGIRASLVCGEAETHLTLPAERNWDLLAERDDAELRDALSILDGRKERGIFIAESSPSVPPDALYVLSTIEDTINDPAPDLSEPLPSFAAPTELGLVLDWIHAVVNAGHWLILRIDDKHLSEFGEATHRKLLRRLGDEHARIWCAPIRDIATYSP